MVINLVLNTCEMFMVSLMRRFVLAKRLFRDLQNSDAHEFAYKFWRSLKSLLAVTERHVRLATNISQVFVNFSIRYCIIYCSQENAVLQLDNWALYTLLVHERKVFIAILWGKRLKIKKIPEVLIGAKIWLL